MSLRSRLKSLTQQIKSWNFKKLIRDWRLYFVLVLIILTVALICFHVHLIRSDVCNDVYTALDKQCYEPKNSPIDTSRLEDRINSLIATKTRDKGRLSTSVFFEDLASNAQFVIFPEAHFYPASMGKVFIMMAYYKELESSPGFDNQVTAVDTIDTSKQYYSHLSSLDQPGNYRNKDLLDEMILYSDNTADDYLAAAIPTKIILDLKNHFGLPQDLHLGDEFGTSAMIGKQYEQLFAADYLAPKSSADALDKLSRNDFYLGLVAGVPRDITVAHKYGEYSAPDGHIELHDCGIIYLPERPYILCVMTQGDNYEDQVGLISTISTQVYRGLVRTARLRSVN